MHELSIMLEVVRRVEAVAKANGSPKVKTIVLQIGEAASVIPRFIEDCYDAAIHQTTLEETKLEIEIIPAMGRCLDCHQVHHLRDSQGICPTCRSKQFEMLSGREFQIKQIAVEDHYESDQNH